jgi:hypothetical protein
LRSSCPDDVASTFGWVRTEWYTSRDADARLGERADACRDVDGIARDLSAPEHEVAEVDPDAAGAAVPGDASERERAVHGIERAGNTA